MSALICGSLAYDTIMVFPDQFKKHILPDQVHMLNVAFLVPEMRREFGGVAGNISYNLKLLGGEPFPMAAVGDDFAPYEKHLDRLGISRRYIRHMEGEFTPQAHYRSGFSQGGGDEFPAPDPYSRIRRIGAKLARRMMMKGIGGSVFRRARSLENATGLGDRARNGNWHGNDTIWRTCLDLNKILYCGDAAGALGGERARRVLNIYDGIIAGDGRGPMGPRARGLGLLAAGEDPAAADLVLSWIMGFDWRKIPVLRESLGELAGGVRISELAKQPEDFPVLWSDSQGARELLFSEIDLNLHLDAHPGWVGHIERDGDGARACAS